MKHVIRKHPGLQSPAWKAARAPNMVVVMIEGEDIPLVVAREVPTEPEARALYSLRAACAMVVQSMHDRFAEHAKQGLLKQSDADRAAANNSAFLAAISMSDAMYHIAFELISSGADIPAIELSYVLQQCLVSGSMCQQADKLPDVRDLTRIESEHHKLLREIETRHSQAAGKKKAAYKAVLEDLKRGGGLPNFIDTSLIGTRGGAATSSKSALRGFLIRSMDAVVPRFKNARYAVIAELLTMSWVEDVDAVKVRAVLNKGKP